MFHTLRCVCFLVHIWIFRDLTCFMHSAYTSSPWKNYVFMGGCGWKYRTLHYSLYGYSRVCLFVKSEGTHDRITYCQVNCFAAFMNYTVALAFIIRAFEKLFHGMLSGVYNVLHKCKENRLTSIQDEVIWWRTSCSRIYHLPDRSRLDAGQDQLILRAIICQTPL